MQGEVSIENNYELNELEAKLEALSKASIKARSIVSVMGGQLMTEMQRQAHFHRYPYKDPHTPPPTGALKNSITLQLEDGGMTARVGPHMYYEAYVEYGTRFMRAEPYVRPAFNIIKPQFLKVMKELVK